MGFPMSLTHPRRFGYVFEPLCLSAITCYLVYRFALRPAGWGTTGWIRAYLNDLLCFPIFITAVLLVHRGLGLRRHDGPPTVFELGLHFVVWSVYFEGIAPRMTDTYRTTADPLDVVAYAV